MKRNDASIPLSNLNTTGVQLASLLLERPGPAAFSDVKNAKRGRSRQENGSIVKCSRLVCILSIFFFVVVVVGCLDALDGATVVGEI